MLFLCYETQEVIIFILKLKTSVFQRRNNVILSTSKQPQNAMLKTTMIFGLTLKPMLFCFTNRLNNRPVNVQKPLELKIFTTQVIQEFLQIENQANVK